MFEQLRPILPKTSEVHDGVLHVGGVSVRDLATEHGTPVIVYDRAHVEHAARSWIEAASQLPGGSTIAFASKAFSSITTMRWMRDLGIGADVSSLGELEVARRAGIDPARSVLHGNNKSIAELDAAVSWGIGHVVLDAEHELELLEQVARAAGTVQSVLVRINPDVEVETHRYISTSHAGSKFGVPGDVAARMLRRAAASDHLDARGVHVHLGSQLLDTEPWREVLAWLGRWARDLRDSAGLTIDVLDIGGGLGIAYVEGDHPPTPTDVVETAHDVLVERWEALGLAIPHVIIEPGRSIVGQAAMTIYSVGVVKQSGDDAVRYVNVDGGMSDNPRPTLYQATYRALLAERCDEPGAERWWIAGVHCESGDVLIEDALLAAGPRPGELLAVPATGAYAASMSSNYNLVPRCAVVSTHADRSETLLRRECIDDVLARDAGMGDATAP